MRLVTARKAAFAVLVTTLAQVTPAFAGGLFTPSPDSIISPGLGTLGAILDWLMLLVS